MLRTISFALPLAFLAASSWAGDRIDCANAMTQYDMNKCASSDYNRADAKLNEVYRALMATLDSRRRQRLIEAGRAWMSYRDAHCRFETTESEGGSMHSLLYDSCLADLTKARTKELQSTLDCQLRRGKCYD